MTPRQRKIAYTLFFSCFALWLFLILSDFTGQWTTTIMFANQFMLALFIGTAILTSISSLLLGLNFLGISLRPRTPRQNLAKELFLSTKQNNKTLKISSVNTPANQNDPKESRDSMKAFYLFGETKFKNCKHEFGHLGNVLKTKPIPDECFGCPKLLECARRSGETRPVSTFQHFLAS